MAAKNLIGAIAGNQRRSGKKRQELPYSFAQTFCMITRTIEINFLSS
jgi:hypothetical protein